mmetsp:Transcript_19545/g.42189  ORF Transcript_19545/g.42189 Transcript_19545/m.42189 type:complete len:245 (-) Transcript_19545:769-1503(-)
MTPSRVQQRCTILDDLLAHHLTRAEDDSVDHAEDGEKAANHRHGVREEVNGCLRLLLDDEAQRRQVDREDDTRVDAEARRHPVTRRVEVDVGFSAVGEAKGRRNHLEVVRVLVVDDAGEEPLLRERLEMQLAELLRIFQLPLQLLLLRLEGPAGAHHLFLRLLLCPDRLCERQLVLLLLPRVLLALALAAVDLALRRLESALGAPRRALFDPRLRLRHRTLAHERVLPHCLRSLETDVRTESEI